MTEHQFDEIFRNKLKDYSSQVPDDFWQRIQPEDKDRKGFIFWLWCLIVPVCLLGGFAGAFYSKSTRPATLHSSFRTSDFEAHPTLSATIPTPANSFLISVATPSLSVTNPTGLSAYPSTAPAYTASANAQTPAYTAHTEPLSPATPLYRTVHPSPSPVRKTAPAQSVSTDGRDTAAISNPGSRDNANNSLDNPLLPDARHGLHKKALAPASSPGDSGALTRSPLPGITPIPYTLHRPSIDKLKRTTAYPVNSPAKKLTPTDPSPKNNFLSSLKKGSWQLDLYASPDMPILQYKNSHQQTQLSFTTGLKINRSFGDHLSGATGLQYSEVNTKVNYDSSINGPTPHTAHLKITSFELPLLIGYGIGNDRFRATLNAGMIFKIRSSGDLHTTSTSIYLGLDLSKKINDKVSLFAEPYYRYSLPGSYNSQYFVQRIHRTGLSLGIRYNFTKARQHKLYNVDQ